MNQILYTQSEGGCTKLFNTIYTDNELDMWSIRQITHTIEYETGVIPHAIILQNGHRWNVHIGWDQINEVTETERQIKSVKERIKYLQDLNNAKT